METEMWIALIVVALAVGGALGWLLMRRHRTTTLRQRFGPEYDNTVRQTGNTTQAERELEKRQERVKRLELRRLSQEEKERFAAEWRGVQSRFVDSPSEAIVDADILVTQVMQAQGYPVGDFEQRAADISVDHPRVVEHYRAARDIADRNQKREATTEDLRQAMVHYRTLFEDLLDTRHIVQKEEA